MSDPLKPSLFEQLGGEPALRAIISDFIDRVMSDAMIGFFFASTQKEQLKAREYEFAAQHLGAHVAYGGRGLPQVHGSRRIMGGHFMRRLEILRQTLNDHGAPPEVIEHWLSHTEKLRPAITQSKGSECIDGASEPRRLPLAFPAMVVPGTDARSDEARPQDAQRLPTESRTPGASERRELPVVGGGDTKKSS